MPFRHKPSTWFPHKKNSVKTRHSPIAALKRAIGRDFVCTDKATRFAASYDSARISFLPDAVIFPQKEEDIAMVLNRANRHKIPVTVRGAGSATTGAASPLYGGWVLNLSHWKKIRIEEEMGMAHVHAGACTAKINAAAEKRGWFYPPDPSSAQYSTIGGNIACNAGGLRGAKYGVTRDYVYALEGFLPTGEPVRWGANLKKYASGYNIRDLWIGSEGTLGVITKATLKLIPKPPQKYTFLAAFPEEDSALRAAIALLKKEKSPPSIFEFIDRQTVCLIERYHGRPLFPEHPRTALLLLEIDGEGTSIISQRKQILSWGNQYSQVLKESRNSSETEALWALRKSCSQAMKMAIPNCTKRNEDVVVPLKSYRALLRYTLALKRTTGLASPTFGHVGDGNFHVHFLYDRTQKEQCSRAQQAVKQLLEKVVSLGGAITGEHGIGLTKSSFLKLQHTPAEIKAMKAIKIALDPNNILNPGKIFTPFPMEKHLRVEVKMPWE